MPWSFPCHSLCWFLFLWEKCVNAKHKSWKAPVLSSVSESRTLKTLHGAMWMVGVSLSLVIVRMAKRGYCLSITRTFPYTPASHPSTNLSLHTDRSTFCAGCQLRTVWAPPNLVLSLRASCSGFGIIPQGLSVSFCLKSSKFGMGKALKVQRILLQIIPRAV